MSTHRLRIRILVAALLSFLGAAAASSWAQSVPVMEAVIGNNFGHLPMFVGVDKGLLRKHGIDLKLRYFADLAPLK